MNKSMKFTSPALFLFAIGRGVHPPQPLLVCYQSFLIRHNLELKLYINFIPCMVEYLLYKYWWTFHTTYRWQDRDRSK